MDSTDKKFCYQAFTALFNYPEQELLDNLQLYLEELSELFSLPIPAELQQPLDLTDLEVAYTGLFINRFGGAPAPPYGSVYLEKDAKLMGESCLRVAESYRNEGLNIDSSDEPADFLATELEFLYYLAANEEAAEESDDAAAASSWQTKQADFFSDLLKPWLPEFCQRIKTSDGGHPLYTWCAEVLEKFSGQTREKNN